MTTNNRETIRARYELLAAETAAYLIGVVPAKYGDGQSNYVPLTAFEGKGCF